MKYQLMIYESRTTKVVYRGSFDSSIAAMTHYAAFCRAHSLIHDATCREVGNNFALKWRVAT